MRLQTTCSDSRGRRSYDMWLSPKADAGEWGPPASSRHGRVLGPRPSPVLRALNPPTRASLKPQRQRQRPLKTPRAGPWQKPPPPGSRGRGGRKLPTNLTPFRPGATHRHVAPATLPFRLGADRPPQGLPVEPSGHVPRAHEPWEGTGRPAAALDEAEGGSGCRWAVRGRHCPGRAAPPQRFTRTAGAPRLEMERVHSARGPPYKPGRDPTSSPRSLASLRNTTTATLLKTPQTEPL